jgi:hypothetical protein
MTEDDNVHVIPVYGREHTLSADCWCCPVPDTEKPDMLIHRTEDECSPSVH